MYQSGVFCFRCQSIVNQTERKANPHTRQVRKDFSVFNFKVQCVRCWGSFSGHQIPTLWVVQVGPATKHQRFGAIHDLHFFPSKAICCITFSNDLSPPFTHGNRLKMTHVNNPMLPLMRAQHFLLLLVQIKSQLTKHTLAFVAKHSKEMPCILSRRLALTSLTHQRC